MKEKSVRRVPQGDEDWELAWLRVCDERKAPFAEAELDRFVEDFIAAMHDVEVLSAMIESHGIAHVKALLRQRFRRLDGNNLINMHVSGPAH